MINANEDKQHERDSSIVKGLEKRIEDFSSYKEGKGICIKLDADKNYEVIDISDHILLELQKILDGDFE